VDAERFCSVGRVEIEVRVTPAACAIRRQGHSHRSRWAVHSERDMRSSSGDRRCVSIVSPERRRRRQRGTRCDRDGGTQVAGCEGRDGSSHSV
jgi:hypothetical protein